MDLQLLKSIYLQAKTETDDDNVIFDRVFEKYSESRSVEPWEVALVVEQFASEDQFQENQQYLQFDGKGNVKDYLGHVIGSVQLHDDIRLSAIRAIVNSDIIDTSDEDAPTFTPQGDLAEVYLDDVVVKTQQELAQQFDHLVGLPQPEQRTQAWYDMRKTRLTASDLAGAIGDSKYDSPYDILLKKCGGEKPFTGNRATQHGVKYEPIATQIYENRNRVKIKEFGLIAHPVIPFLGASPDGIVEHSDNISVSKGTMLEIKCPPTRQITGEIPIHYLIQMQLQLECCDLEVCDFEECQILEYFWEEDFWEDVDQDETRTADGMEKGVLIEYYDHEKKKVDYKYPPLGLSKIDTLQWVNTATADVIHNPAWAFNTVLYWYLKKYSCVRVKRDRHWFQTKYPVIEAFWKNVLFYRQMGLDKLRADFDKKERKTRVKKEAAPVEFLSDSDRESAPRRTKVATKKRVTQSAVKKGSKKPTLDVTEFLSDSDE